MKKTKRALFHSLIALLLCVSMFVGTTFAWFTDEVTSMNNIIQSGRLDIELEYRDADGEWQPVDQDTNVFDPNALWEPGHTEVVYLRVKNLGNLALKYELGVNVASQTLGTNVYGDPFKLSDYIEMGAVKDMASTYATREDARNAVTASGTLSSGYVTYGSMEAGAAEQYIALVVYMPEEVDNVANYKTGTTPPTINLGITLLATQMTAENDSFGNNYDEGAKHPLGNINFTSTQSIADKMEDGQLTEAVTVGSTDGDIYAEVPSGVKLADGADSLSLTVQALQSSEADITLEAGETANSLEVHIDGLAEDNAVPMQITLKGVLPTGLNSTSVALYHVEDGVTVPMTQVNTPVNHNEFSYDPATGDVTMALASFSEVAVVSDAVNAWDGTTTVAYTGSGTEADPYLISNAEQLAYFRDQVDGGNTFEVDGVKQYVKLDADINLGDHNFDPIGYGYDYKGYNSSGEKGQTFNGIFDGDNHTISNLKVNGWELGISYSNCGGGLFASVCDATIKNLTMSNANIVMECVEQGVIAGLAQGTCTFDNIKIYGCKVANYQRATGGLVGEVSPKYNEDGTVDADNSQTHTFTNIEIDATTVIGSLWGDFDAPVGGVIGARWDDSNTTKVVMKNVNVACRLDVYNDVTSAYQWYAYRRAGMLIGNTEESTDHTATATFLTCENVVVYYGDWVNYHYCEFTNQTNSWQNNYPWVRVEAGENCSAYSNPRYGHPVIGENQDKIVDSLHTHAGDDEHLVLLPFDQLYGGGQGVYGSNAHIGNGVEYGLYTITYIDNGKVIGAEFVTDEGRHYLEQSEPTSDVYTFDGWVQEDGTVVAVDNDSYYIENTGNNDLIIYPIWKEIRYVRCIDMNNQRAYYAAFTTTDTTNHAEIVENVKTALANIQAEVDHTGKVIVAVWEGYEENGLTADDLASATEDIVLKAIPQLSTESITLEKVYDETTGELVSYRVTGVENTDSNVGVVIPPYVGVTPVTEIASGAFADFENLTAVEIPSTVETIASDAFPGNKYTGRETITIYYAGTVTQWNDLFSNESWCDCLGDGSRVFFLNENGKVDADAGYWEIYADDIYIGKINHIWKYHSHEYDHATQCNCGNDVSGAVTNYLAQDSNGEYTRVDAGYWPAETTTE